MKHYNVVAAVVYKDNKFLCMQKGKTKFEYTSYKFEFPGGKIEPGETPQQALKRELLEEMNYNINVGKEIITVNHTYPDFSITMTAFLCNAESDSFILKEHISFKWETQDNLRNLDWAEADVNIVNAICEL